MANETTKKSTKKTKKTTNADTISLDAAMELINETVTQQEERLKVIVEELKPKKKVKDKDDAKEFKVTLRFKTAKEREKLNKTADKKGLSTSAYLKFLIQEFPKLEKEVKDLRKKLAD
ncbi:MAG: hypothetical protein DI615_03110 [Gardnerella vaginalis]|jgi:hypothetical protein|nr:MAG: hypothetical protein DI615_03110 [Gardnerella vaginalis]PZP10974.1 MAG: hypothetical protein DI614_03110 [Gardnerella vaginalis]